MRTLVSSRFSGVSATSDRAAQFERVRRAPIRVPVSRATPQDKLRSEVFASPERISVRCLWVYRRLARTTTEETLDQPALNAMRQCLGHDVSVARDRGEVFLEGFLPRLAKPLARAHQVNSFRCQALLPASLFIAAFAIRVSAAHLPTPWHAVFGTSIGLLAFGLGIQTAITELLEEARALNIAVLVAAKDATKPPQ